MMAPHKLLVLYASQTGTAQEVAERIWRESKSRGFDGPISSMDDLPIERLPSESLVVFVCSTTGQGDPPDNMAKFWKFLLRRSLPSNSLQNMKFAVLGLGDSSYVKFNFVAKKLHRRLETLSASPLIPAGLADDQHDLGADAVVDAWLSQLWQELSQKYPADVRDTAALPLARWSVSILESAPDLVDLKKDTHIKLDNADLHRVEVISNERVTPESHFQNVRHIKLRLPASLEYSPGDVAYVYPHNQASSTRQCLELLEARDEPLPGWTRLCVQQNNEYMPVPAALHEPLTVRELATCYWDLNAVPKRYAFEVLAHFTSSDLEREKLLELSSAEGQTELLNYARRPRRSVLEMLTDFPHATRSVPVQYLFEIFSPIRPRAFSIASSPTADPSEIHLLVAVVKYKTKLLIPRHGLCSSYLASLTCGQTLVCCVKRGSFLFPKDRSTPVIMVGPGTGVAPFRSYIRTRLVAGTGGSAALYLYFGCRNQGADFFWREEWETAQAQDLLTLHCAFSRDQPDKIYVQHVMSRHLPLLSELICVKHATVLIAGNANEMPKAVRQVLEDAVSLAMTQDLAKQYVEDMERTGNLAMTHDLAKQYVEDMERTGRLQTETWS